MGQQHGPEEDRTEAGVLTSVGGSAVLGRLLQLLLLALSFLQPKTQVLFPVPAPVISMEKSARSLVRLEIGLFQCGLWSGKMELSPQAAGESLLLPAQALCDASYCSWASYYLLFRQPFLSN